jgi:serine O-acetyltransferase
LTLSHTAGVIIHALAQIGDGCVLTSGVVIGGNGRGGVPRIGNHVFIGANAVIVGDVVIGNQATIGAGTVVVKNIPDYALAVGNPSQIVKTSYIRPYYNSSLVNPT